MTRLAAVHGAINLGQGFPDFPAPQELKDAAARAIAEDHNQYPITWGVQPFREAIAAKYLRDYGMNVDPETEICVTCGSTEAMIAAMLGILDPGDEVVSSNRSMRTTGPTPSCPAPCLDRSGCARPIGRSMSRSCARPSTIARVPS